MAQAAGATKVFGASTASAGVKMGGLQSAAILAGGGIALGFGVAVKSALDFENSMTRVRVNSNLTNAEIDNLRGSILELAGQTGQAPKDLADALYFLASAGLDATQVQETLAMSAKAAAIGLGTVDSVARLTATALNAYAKDGITAAKVTDTLAAAVREGTAEPDEFANALGRIMPIAQKAGVEFEEVTASLAGLSNIGLDVNEGVTAMRGLLQSLVAPTQQTQDALAELGITTDELRTVIAEDGIVAALRMLEESTGGNIDKLRDLIPNVRAITGAFGLTGQEVEKLDGLYRRVTSAQGDLNNAFEEWLEGPGAGVATLFGKLQALAIKLGTILLPLFEMVVKGLSALMDILTPVVDLFAKLPPTLQQVALGVGALAVATKALGLSNVFLGTAMKAVPWIAVAIGIGEVTKQLDLVDKEMDSMQEFLDVSKNAGVEVESMGDEMAKAGVQIAALARQSEASTGRLQGQADAFEVIAEATAKARNQVQRFAGMSVKELRDWQAGTVDSFNTVEGALERLADKHKVTADQILKHFRRALRAQAEFGDNWKAVVNRAGQDGDEFLAHIQENFGAQAPQIVAALADANEREFRAIVRAWNEGERSAEELAGVVSGSMNRTAGSIARARSEAEKFAGNLRELLGFSDIRITADFRALNQPEMGDGPGAIGGLAADWANQAMAAVPGAQSISSGYRTPAANAAAGGSPTSYHMDPNNPAQDIVGSNLDAIYSYLQRFNYRELLWQVPGHYDHVHVADRGAIVRGPALIAQGNITEAHIPMSGPGASAWTAGIRDAVIQGFKAIGRPAQVPIYMQTVLGPDGVREVQHQMRNRRLLHTVG